MSRNKKPLRSMKRAVFSRSRVDEYVERVRNARLLRETTCTEILVALKALSGAMADKEDLLDDIAAKLALLPTVDHEYRLAWRSSADIAWQITPRGPYWLRVSAGDEQPLPSKTEKGRRRKPTVEEIREAYGPLAESAKALVNAAMGGLREYEKLSEQFLSVVTPIVHSVPVITSLPTSPVQRSRNFRAAVLESANEAIQSSLREIALLESELDDLMLDFNTAGPGGFGTFSVHWVVRPVARTVSGPTGPEFRVCLNYSPGAGRVLMKPLGQFTIGETGKAGPDGVEDHSPSNANADSEKRQDNCAKIDGATNTPTAEAAASNKGKKARPKRSSSLTKAHIRFARLSKYEDTLLDLSKKIDALKERRDMKISPLLNAYNILKRSLK